MSLSVDLDFLSSAFKAVTRTDYIDIVPKQKAPYYARSFDLDTLHARSLQWCKVSRDVSPSPTPSALICPPVSNGNIKAPAPSASSAASPPVSKSGDSAPSGVYTGPVTRSRKRKRKGEINVHYRHKTLKINVDIDDHSVLDVKLKIQEEEGLTPEQVGGLMFSGRFLDDREMLEDCNVQIGEKKMGQSIIKLFSIEKYMVDLYGRKWLLFGRPWSTMLDHGRPTMVNRGRSWSTFAHHGRPW